MQRLRLCWRIGLARSGWCLRLQREARGGLRDATERALQERGGAAGLLQEVVREQLRALAMRALGAHQAPVFEKHKEANYESSFGTQTRRYCCCYDP